MLLWKSLCSLLRSVSSRALGSFLQFCLQETSILAPGMSYPWATDSSLFTSAELVYRKMAVGYWCCRYPS